MVLSNVNFYSNLFCRSKDEESQTSSRKSDKEDESSENDSSEEEEDSSEEEIKPPQNNHTNSKKSKSIVQKSTPQPSKQVKKEPQKSNLDLLLDLDADISNTMTPVMTPSMGGFLTPISQPLYPVIPVDAQVDSIIPVPPSFIPTKNFSLLDRINGRGLSLTYRFTRSAHLFSPHMVNIGLTFTNSNQEDITEIKVGKKVRTFIFLRVLRKNMLECQKK